MDIKQKSKFQKSKFLEDFNLLVETDGFVSFFGIKIRSYEGLELFKITFSVVVVIFICVFGIIFSRNTIIYAFISGFICYFIPSEYVKAKIFKKNREILLNLPDIIDLMSSLLKAGLTLEQTISYISKNYTNPISKLFRYYQLKVFEGFSRKNAFEYISKISFCSEFKSFIKVIYQAEEIGNPIADSLKDLSRVYRNNQRDLIKMRAERIESNLIIVIFIFIFLPMLAFFLVPVLPQLKFLF